MRDYRFCSVGERLLKNVELWSKMPNLPLIKSTSCCSMEENFEKEKKRSKTIKAHIIVSGEDHQSLYLGCKNQDERSLEYP